jgi:hypothetical protein
MFKALNYFKDIAIEDNKCSGTLLYLESKYYISNALSMIGFKSADIKINGLTFQCKVFK